MSLLKELFGPVSTPRKQNRRRPTQKRCKRRKQSEQGLHAFKVEKPFCAPCTVAVAELSNKYELPIYGYKESVSQTSIKDFARKMRMELKSFENLKYGPAAIAFLPLACTATFQVPKARARWFEDIINYDGRLQIVEGTIDPKSYARGKRGKIRYAWKERADYQGSVGAGGIKSYKMAGMEVGQSPQVESNCKKGNAIWKQVDKIVKENRADERKGRNCKPRKRRQ